MRPLSAACLTLLGTALFAAGHCHAARPMVTDDARVTEAGACQIESWWHQHRGGQELWSLPACNPGGNLEITVGGALSRSAGRMESGAQQVQAKTLFKPLATNGYGIGLAAGYVVLPGDTRSGAPYFYIPTSFSFADDRFVLHTNLGAIRERENHATRLSWGVGGELLVAADLYVIAETYGQDVGRPFFQLGLRYWIVPDRVQVDTTYGNRVAPSGDARWFSLGLRLLFPPIF